MRDAPGARIPELRVRLRTKVRNPCSVSLHMHPCSICFTLSWVGLNCRIFSTSVAPSCNVARQKAATSWSLSIMTHWSVKSSIMAVRETIPPPANGSIKTLGFDLLNHSRIWGMSHVLPPGYRRGLRCGTFETLTAGIRDMGNGVIVCSGIVANLIDRSAFGCDPLRGGGGAS